MTEGQRRPELQDVVGITNKLRVLAGKKPKYNADTLSKIAGRGMSPVEMSNRAGTIRDAVGMYSWQTVYDAYLASGLSPEKAKEETDARVWSID